jgi:hypothetical protein
MFKTWTSGPEMGPVQSPQGGLSSGPGGWHPTVLYLLVLVVLEIIVAGFLSRHLLS